MKRLVSSVLCALLILSSVCSQPLLAFAQEESSQTEQPVDAPPADPESTQVPEGPDLPPNLEDLLNDSEFEGQSVTPPGTEEENSKNSSAPKPKSFSLDPESLQGEFVDLLSGKPAVSFPIVTPSGINGISPSLEIRYNDRQLNGPIGQGWELMLGEIKRVNKHGINEMYKLENFSVSFQGFQGELSRVSHDSSANTMTYQMKRENQFALFVYDLTGKSWTVMTKDGMRYRFGSTDESRMQDVTGEMIYSWQIDEMADQHGNIVQYEYKVLSQIPYPKVITYGGVNHDVFEVRFEPFASRMNPAKNRSDNRMTYETGFEVAYDHVIESIDIAVEGNVRMSYELDYLTNDLKSRTDLTEIEVIGMDENAIETRQSTQLSYYNKESGFTGEIAHRLNFLREISYHTGAKVSFEYLPSTQLFSNLGVKSKVAVHYPFYVVSSVKKSDFRRSDTWTYSYNDGFFFYESVDERQLAGFGRVTVTDPLSQKTTTYFHQGGGFDGGSLGESSIDNNPVAEGRWSLIGHPYRMEVKDSQGRMIRRMIMKWQRSEISENRYFTRMTDEVSSIFNTSGENKSSAKRFAHDIGNGNLTETQDYGEVTANDNGTYDDTGSDDRTIVTEYAENTAEYLLSYPKSQELKDKDGQTITKTEMEYDDLPLGEVEKGNLTKESRLLKGPTQADDRMISGEMTYNSRGQVTGSTDANGNTNTVSYDLTGIYPATTTNALGHVSTMEVDLMFGQVMRSVDPNGLVSETDLDGLGRPVEVRVSDPDASNAMVTMQTMEYLESSYPHGMKTTVHLDDTTIASSTTFMDGFGRGIQTRTPMDDDSSVKYSVTNTEYDALGRVVHQSLPVMHSGTAYDAAQTSSIGTETSYDVLNRPVTITDANGTTNISYDLWSTTTTDPMGNTKTTESDAFGRLVTVIERLRNPSGEFRTTYAYDERDLLTKLTDAQNNVRHFTYDSLGRMTEQEDLHAPSDTDFATTTMSYDDHGNLLTSTDAMGNIIARTYDALHRQITQDPSGGAGSMSAVSASYGMSYDSGTNALGRLTGIISNDYSAVYEYDLRGRMISETNTIDGDSYEKTYQYTRFDQPREINYPNGTTISMQYNAVGQVKRVDADGDDVVSSIEYNPINQVAEIRYGNGVTSTMTYDPQMMYRMTQKITRKVTTASLFVIPNGVPTQSGRNEGISAGSFNWIPRASAQSSPAIVEENAQVDQIFQDQTFSSDDPIIDPITGEVTFPQDFTPAMTANDPVGTNGKPAITFLGDETGNKSVVSGVISATVTYRNLNPNAPQAVGYVTLITKNGTHFWQQTPTQYFSSPLNVGDTSSELEYDISRLTDNKSDYSIQIRLLLASDFLTPYSNPALFRLPGENRRPSQVDVPTEPDAPDTDTYQNITYAYDAMGNIVRVEEQAGVPGRKTANYSYDDLYRLTTANVSNSMYSSPNGVSNYQNYTENYTYDSVGNMLSKSDQGNYSYTQPGKTSPHAVTSISGARNQSFQYDDLGNLTEHMVNGSSGNTTKSYEWDVYNRMVKSTVSSSDSSIVVTTYLYDHTGRRIKKQTLSNTSAGSVSTTTVYPFGDFEVTDSGSTKVSVMANTLHVATIESGVVVATCPEPCIGSGATQSHGRSSMFFSHTDHLGGGNVMTAENGNLVQALDYFPFGSVRIDEQYSDFDERKKFTGHELDDETSLYYAQARYYDSEIGRFVSQDTVASNAPQKLLADPQQLNTYSYTRNHPINAIDPDGKLTIFIHGTFSNPNDGFSMKVRDTITKDLGDTNTYHQSLQWNGKIGNSFRSEPAGVLTDYINNYSFSEGEQLNIVGHSHGGNVGIEAINNGLNKQVDNLLIFSTPNRSEYQLNDRESVNNFVNIFSRYDTIIQKVLGAFPNPNWESTQVRSEEDVWNIDVGVKDKYQWRPSEIHSWTKSEEGWERAKDAVSDHKESRSN